MSAAWTPRQPPGLLEKSPYDEFTITEVAERLEITRASAQASRARTRSAAVWAPPLLKYPPSARWPQILVSAPGDAFPGATGTSVPR
ncbi:MAG: hypothetical protein H0T52_06975 [Lautropia sp.]|nr:hypothetical protein [Lautropia sp.]